jgi:hypothetical protein
MMGDRDFRTIIQKCTRFDRKRITT